MEKRSYVNKSTNQYSWICLSHLEKSKNLWEKKNIPKWMVLYRNYADKTTRLSVILRICFPNAAPCDQRRPARSADSVWCLRWTQTKQAVGFWCFRFSDQSRKTPKARFFAQVTCAIISLIVYLVVCLLYSCSYLEYFPILIVNGWTWPSQVTSPILSKRLLKLDWFNQVRTIQVWEANNLSATI